MRRRVGLGVAITTLVGSAASGCSCGASGTGDADAEASEDAGREASVEAGLPDGEALRDAAPDCHFPPPEPCDGGRVTCDDAPPDCPPGYYPARDAARECWAGYCAPCDIARECDRGCDELAPCPEGTFRAPPDGGMECGAAQPCLSCRDFCGREISMYGCMHGGDVCSIDTRRCPPWQRPGFNYVEEYDLACFDPDRCVPCDDIVGPVP